MAVVNANYEFIMVDMGANGGMFSSMEFHRGVLKNNLYISQPDNLLNSETKQPYVFMAADVFPLNEAVRRKTLSWNKPHLITGYLLLAALWRLPLEY